MPTDFFIGLCVLVVAFGVAHLAVTGWLANPFGAWISDPNDPNNVTIEAAIREEIWKPTGKLTKADLNKLTELNLESNQLTGLPKDLEKLTQLESLGLEGNQLTELPKALEKLDQLETLNLTSNQLTDVKGLEKLAQLTFLSLEDNPDLTKAQIDELQKALPKCIIFSTPTK